MEFFNFFFHLSNLFYQSNYYWSYLFMKSVWNCLSKYFQWFWSTFWKLCILAWDFAFAALRAIFQLKIGLEDEVGKGGLFSGSVAWHHSGCGCGWILNCVWYHYSDACTVSDINIKFIRLCLPILNSESTKFLTIAFTNLEFRIYKVFNEYLLWFLFDWQTKKTLCYYRLKTEVLMFNFHGNYTFHGN